MREAFNLDAPPEERMRAIRIGVTGEDIAAALERMADATNATTESLRRMAQTINERGGLRPEMF